MSKLEVDTIAPQSGTTLTVGEAGDTVDISNATLSANLNASSLTSGTIPDARFPATLPAVDGSQLTGVQIAGGYTICDSITVTNTDTFALTSGGSPVSPESAANCLVSLNGILQAPISSYTISGSNIIFASALVAGSDVIDFITVLGTALNIGTPSDGTVGLNKLSATGTKDSTTFLRGDNTFAVPGGGKVLQVVTATDSTERSTTSTSYVTASNTLSVTITPSSSSNKILILVSGCGYGGSGGVFNTTIYKNGSNLTGASGFLRSENGSAVTGFNQSIIYLDSPATTSATTYQVYIKTSTATALINLGGSTGTITAMEISA